MDVGVDETGDYPPAAKVDPGGLGAGEIFDLGQPPERADPPAADENRVHFGGGIGSGPAGPDKPVVKKKVPALRTGVGRAR